MAPSLLQAAGAAGDKPVRYAPLYTNRFFLGLATNRNPLRSPAGVIYENFYRIGGTDALIAGRNVELSPRLTIARRPGHTAGLAGVLSSANVPDIPLAFYSFHEINGTVRVFVDTASQVFLLTSSAVVPIFTKAAGAGQSFYQGIGQSLFFSDPKEQQKWLDFGAGNPGNSFAAVTATALAGNVATVTAVNNFAAGQTVVVSGTANGAGALNGTFVVASANANQFTFNLTHADIASAADSGFASGTWNWQIAAPAAGPTLNVVASGAAAVAWTASTVFSTMGLIVDPNGNVEQMISVNAKGTNATQFGTTSNGEPNWNQTPGGTTTDNTITWTNWGPVPAWTANTTYNNGAIGGTLANPSQIFDPTSKAMEINIAPGNAQGTSGGTKPNFLAIQGAILKEPTQDSPPSVKWFSVFPAPTRWKPNTSYPKFLGSDMGNEAIVEPFDLPAPNNQTVFLQISGGGTSGASGTAPRFVTVAGQQTSDGDIIWLNQGSAAWAANTQYTAWTGTQPVFSVVKDTNGNMQVCVVSGKSGSAQPLQQWQAAHVYALNDVIIDSNGNKQTVTTAGTSGNSKTLTNSVLTAGVATYTTSVAHGYAAGQQVTVTGSTHNATFNIVNAIIVSTPLTTTFTVNIAHDDIATAADTGTSVAGPTWNTVLAGTTADGTVVWTNGGAANGWGVQYGDTTKDGTAVWVNVGQSMSWAASTQWFLPTGGFQPPSPTQPYGGAQVISGTSPNQFVQAVVQSGKSDTVAPTFSTTSLNFVLDPATSNTQITWRNVAAFSQDSIVFTRGFGYAYSYEARTATDPFNTAPPPGLAVPLGTPTGSADGSVSTASPTVLMPVAPNTGAVIFVSGLGSTDPQCDTVNIFRTADGGATFFLLTKIKNPQPIGGVAQPWTFKDFLPDQATSKFPGLNTLVLAPLNHQGDPPPAMTNIVQHFGRIWGSVGNNMVASMGPLVGGANQPPGNAYTSFNPSQAFSFPSPVTKNVPTTTALLVFTTSDLFYIAGGPNILTMFPNILIPGLGLTSPNALAVEGGLIFLLTADNQCVSLDPNMGVTEIGFPIGDQVNKISPSNAYVAFHIQGSFDKALYLADGSTGWFRCNPHQAPDSAISGPVWSPKAGVVGGAKAIASLEVSPGLHALLVGATQANKPILVRDSNYQVFSDNGQAYPADFTLGSIVLAQPGQIAELGFITAEFNKVGTSPKLSILLDETSGAFEDISGFTFPATGLPPQDPPLLFGATLQPATIFANRYYFAQSVGGAIPPQGTSCRHMQMKVDFGAADSVQNEILSLTIFGRLFQEL